MKKIGVFAAVIASMFLLAGAVMAADITNPLLKKLVEKRILTQEEAKSIMQDVQKEATNIKERNYP